MELKFSPSSHSPQPSTSIYNAAKHTFSNTLSQIPQDRQHHFYPTNPLNPPSSFDNPIFNFTQTNSKTTSPDKPHTVQPFRSQTPLSKDSINVYDSSARKRINAEGGHIKELMGYYDGLQQMVGLLKEAKMFVRDMEE